MDISNPVEKHCQAHNSFSPKEKSTQMHGYGSTHIDLGDASDCETVIRSDGMPLTTTNNFVTPSQIKKKVNPKLEGRKYTLRSSSEGARVLRSTSSGACNTTTNASTHSISLTTERRRKGKKRKQIVRASNDELSGIRKRVKYLLARMNFEQSLIAAYSGEGWKGQSAERVKLEKELQRAASEILRCKLEMRDLFQRLDALCAEGKLLDSLYDSEGRIDSEDIFCAKCGSKDLSANNDIVLCDGFCNRGFHQMCLVPPLLNIPPGDESWLCPGCDCKVDCIDLLNDIQGTNLSVEDKWEKVFPEAAAVAAGDKQHDELGLPSDDSEDDDYDPDHLESNEKSQKESSSSEESGSTSASDGSSSSIDDIQRVKSGFSSDDSEDNDYDPDAPELDDKEKSEGSSSGASDFSSDTNDLIPSKYDNDSDSDESSPNHTQPMQNHPESVGVFDGEPKTSRKMFEMLSTLERDQIGENSFPISGKRRRERLDYKKLHDEAYGNIPSDSSDDEDWIDNNTQKKVKKSGQSKAPVMSSLENDQTIQEENSTKPSRSSPQVEDLAERNLHNLHKHEKLPDSRNLHNLESDCANHILKPYSLGKKVTTSGPGRYGREVSQRLCESFQVNAYPTQEVLDNLSKELGITVHQASMWFEDIRRSLCLPEVNETNADENGTLDEENIPTKVDVEDPESEVKVVSANKEASKTEAIASSKDNIHAKTNVKDPETQSKIVFASEEASRTEISTPNKDNIPSKNNVKDSKSGPEVFLATKTGSETENSTKNKHSIPVLANAKEPESEVKVVVDGLASSRGEGAQLINASTNHVTSNSKGRRQVGVTTPRWNSAKYESKKRRQAKLDGQAANVVVHHKK